jgi:subfamily B ATP-binding cassette protein HlyB/CyaB
VPFAPALVLQQLPPPYTLLSVQRAAFALGFEGAVRDVAVTELERLPLPFMAVLQPSYASSTAAAAVLSSGEGSFADTTRDARSAVSTPGPGSVAPNPPTLQPGRGDTDAEKSDPPPVSGAQAPRHHPLALVVEIANGKVSFLAPNNPEPVVVALSEFGRSYAGQVMLFAPRLGEQANDRDTELHGSERFGFRWFVPELLKHKAIGGEVLLASLAIQVMALATPVFTQIVIDKVIVHHTLNTLIVIGVALTIFMLFTAVMSWIRQYLILHTGNRIDAVLGTEVFEHLFKLPPRYFEQRPTGVLIARLHGVETIREFITGAAVTLLLDVPFLLIFLAIMYYYSSLLTFITLIVLLLIVGMSASITPLLRSRLNKQFLLGARNQAFLTEYVAGMETVKSLQMEPQLKQRFGEYLSSYLRAGFDTRRLANTYNVIANMLEQLLTLAILCTGAWLVMNSQDFTIGMLVAFQMFASRLSGPVLRMVGLWQEFQQASIAVKRLGDVMNVPPEPYSLKPSRETAGRGSIAITGLSFRYADNLPFLYRDLSLSIEPGKCMAIMGPSGSGKSTLAKLLQGFYRPVAGSIRIDGHDVLHLSANELRRNFGVVPQDTVLFSGTIYDNLILSNPLATFDEVIRACKLAEIHDSIEGLPQGYQNEIGEHGAGLSGGQKQRVAIARALLKGPPILIFDEATSSLDGPTAEAFAHTINRLKGKVTMLFIAHNLPGSLQVDAVLRLGEPS